MALININKLKQASENALNAAKKAAKDAEGWSSQAVKDASKWTSQVKNSAASTIQKTTSIVSGNVGEYATNTIVKLIKGVNIDSLLAAVIKYGQEHNKNVSATVNFLNKLKDLQEDGK